MQHEPLLKAAPFSGSRVQPFDGTRRYLSTGDLQEATTSFVEVTYADKPSRADISVRTGDVLFARMKGTKKVLEIDRALVDIIVSTGFAVIRPTEHCNGKYLSIYLKSDDFERQKEKYCSGAIQPAITNAGIKNLTIPFPPLDDQKRIAHLLGKVEGLIAQRKHHLQQLDDLLKSVFLEMFGILDQTYKQWIIDKLATRTEIVSGVTKGKKYKSEELFEVPYMRVANVQDGYFILDEIKTISVTQKEINQYQLQAGDLLLTEGGDPDKLGRGSVWENQVEKCIHQNHIFRVRINERLELNPYYLSALIGSRYGKSYFLKSAKQTTGIASINSTQLKNFPLIIPPIDLQNQFAAIVEKVESLKSRYQHSLTDLESLYGALSQKAFKGELDLSRVVRPVAATTEDTDSTEGLNRETREQRESLKKADGSRIATSNPSIKQPIMEGRAR